MRRGGGRMNEGRTEVVGLKVHFEGWIVCPVVST
jgi:hypothetical protein